MGEYKCWCHVCGDHYVFHADFAAGPVHVQNDTDYLIRACNEHTPELKRESWTHYQKTGKPFNTGKPSTKRIGFSD